MAKSLAELLFTLDARKTAVMYSAGARAAYQMASQGNGPDFDELPEQERDKWLAVAVAVIGAAATIESAFPT